MTDAIDKAMAVASRYGRLPANYDFYEPPGVKGYTTTDINQAIANRTPLAPAMEALLDGINTGLSHARLPGYLVAGAISPVAKLAGGLQLDPSEGAGIVAGLGSLAKPTGARPRLPAPKPEPPAGPWTWTDSQFRNAMGDLWDYRARPYTWKEPAPLGAKVDVETLEALQDLRAKEGMTYLEKYDPVHSRPDAQSKSRSVDEAFASKRHEEADRLQRELETMGAVERDRGNYNPYGVYDKLSEMRPTTRNVPDYAAIKRNRDALGHLNDKVQNHYDDELPSLGDRLDRIRRAVERLEAQRDNWPKNMPRPFSADDMGIEPVVQGTLMYGALKGADWKPAEPPFTFDDVRAFLNRRPGAVQ